MHERVESSRMCGFADVAVLCRLAEKNLVLCVAGQERRESERKKELRTLAMANWCLNKYMDVCLAYTYVPLCVALLQEMRGLSCTHNPYIVYIYIDLPYTFFCHLLARANQKLIWYISWIHRQTLVMYLFSIDWWIFHWFHTHTHVLLWWNESLSLELEDK